MEEDGIDEQLSNYWEEFNVSKTLVGWITTG